MRNEEIEKEWLRIWTHSSNVDDAVDLIIRNRALPEDVDYALNFHAEITLTPAAPSSAA